VQLAGIAALTGDQSCLAASRAMYQERRDVLVEGLGKLGLAVESPRATFYVWCPCPAGINSAEFTKRLLNECGIVSTPGNGFGPSGEGFVRFALTVDKARLQEAVSRLAALGL
jgi:LL-diaminopimelate aminotransferase